MRKDYEIAATRDSSVFAKGELVRCTNDYGKNNRVPELGLTYTVLNCYYYHGDIFLDLESSNGFRTGGWYARNFELAEMPGGHYMRMRPKKDPGIPLRFDNHRRICLE
jgi:hypothetical protein